MTLNIGEADYTSFRTKPYEDMASYNDPSIFKANYNIEGKEDGFCSTYQNTNWNVQLGAYFDISEIGAMIDTKARYVVGKGFKASGKYKKTLDGIRGNGLDTANMIFYNAVRVYTTGGDFYAEIIKNSRGELKNLKPLNPSTVIVHSTNKGMISHYEVAPQTDGATGGNSTRDRFEKDEIFHLAYNRMGDQNHGQSVIEKLEPIIKMRREAMNDLRVVFHRYVKPLLISSVDTDDASEIAKYKVKIDSAMALGENLVVPKGTVDSIDRVSIPQFSTLDPLPWIQLLQNEFLKAEGMPAVAMGSGSQSTESESKILYLAWQQVVEFNQMFLEEQIKAQLGLEVKFEFPASIAEELTQDEGKDVQKENKFNTKPDSGHN